MPGELIRSENGKKRGIEWEGREGRRKKGSLRLVRLWYILFSISQAIHSSALVSSLPACMNSGDLATAESFRGHPWSFLRQDPASLGRCGLKFSVQLCFLFFPLLKKHETLHFFFQMVLCYFSQLRLFHPVAADLQFPYCPWKNCSGVGCYQLNVLSKIKIKCLCCSFMQLLGQS